jgi:hypothetical protein
MGFFPWWIGTLCVLQVVNVDAEQSHLFVPGFLNFMIDPFAARSSGAD